MRICVLGTGYVGVVTGSGLASIGHQVVCVDIDSDKIDRLQQGEIPLFEPGLAELVADNLDALAFTTDAELAIGESELVIVAVGTPGGPDGRADLRALRAAAKQIAAAAQCDLMVMIKSTVPVGTGDKIEQLMQEANPARQFDVISNPEFLREGSAVRDFLHPDRIVFGRENPTLDDKLRLLYRGLGDVPAVFTGRRSAELIKYAANSYLAMKVTFINEMADIAEQVGADIDAISEGIGLDPRIGPSFLQAGPGFGGSCFPKDMLALIRTAQDANRPSRLIETTVDVNNHRISGMSARVVAALGGNAAGKRVALLGITFKANTDDVRASAAIAIAQNLLAAKAEVRVHDPEGMANAAPLLKGAIFCNAAQSAVENADVLVIATEWPEFNALDLDYVGRQMAEKVLVDLRNIFDRGRAEQAGFRYYPVGKG